jgi:hypothetical protein
MSHEQRRFLTEAAFFVAHGLRPPTLEHGCRNSAPFSSTTSPSTMCFGKQAAALDNCLFADRNQSVPCVVCRCAPANGIGIKSRPLPSEEVGLK